MRPSLPANVVPALLLAAILAGAAPLGRSPLAVAQPVAPPDLEVTLYSNTVILRTLPYAPITALLDNGAGGRAEGFGFSGPDGAASVMFFDPASGFDGSQVVRPGSRLSFARPGQSALVVTVPELAADVDVLGDRIVGRASAGLVVDVVVLVGDGAAAERIERRVEAGGDGAFQVDLSGEHDLRPGAASGTASVTLPDSVQVVAAMAASSADLTLGATSLRGRSTPGTTVAVAIRRADGTTTTHGPLVNVEDASFAIGTPASFLPPLPPLAAGDAVTVTVTGGVLTAPRMVTGTLGAIAVVLHPSDEAVTGTAPAGAPVALTADALDGQRHDAAAVAGADGAFAADWLGAVDLRAGWRVRASYAAAPGLTVGALAVIPAIHVGVGLAESRGLADPGQVVTVTLEAAAGGRRTTRATADDRGDYTIAFGSPFSPMPSGPQPGDRIEVAVVQDDPLVLEVPVLTALSDVAADAVRGEAPPGAAVRVRVDSAEGVPTADAVADAGGAYRAGFAGVLDLARPANGIVTLTRGDGNAFFTTWAAIQINATVGNELQSSFVAGNGPVGRWVSVELRSPSGAVVATGGSPVFGGDITGLPGLTATGAAFFTSLTDIAGTPVVMESGDTLRVAAGDEVTELLIPQSEAVILIPADTVAGRTAPNADVTVWISKTPPAIDVEGMATADAAGNYVVNFTGQHDILYGDQVLVGAKVDGHQVLDLFIAPGLLLEADQGVLLGSLAPDMAVDVTVRRGAAVVARATARTDSSGTMTAVLAGVAGVPLVIQPGDVVRVVGSDPSIEALSLTVPELTIAWDVEADTVTGTATTGGSLTMLATVAYPRPGTFGIAQSWPALSASGGYATDFVPAPDIAPGSRITALYRPASGNYVIRSRTVSILNAEHGGPNACGFGVPRATADLALRDGATTRSSASPATRFDGYFSSVWRGADDEPVASAAGQHIAADLGDAAADLALPPLELVVDWATGQVSGSGPASAAFTVQPAVPCPMQQPPGLLNFGPTFALPGETEPDGTFSTFNPAGTAPGAGFEIAFYGEGGHRWFRHAYRASATVYIDEDRVGGVATALSPVSVVLRSSAGDERAQGAATAGPSANYQVRLAGASGEPVIIRASDVIELRATGMTETIAVEPLSFDWSPGAAAIAGSAPAGRAVQLQLRLESGAIMTIPLQADAAGALGFAAADVPPRAAWSLADVVGVRLTLGTPNGHAIVAQTVSFEPGPAGPRGPEPVYFPVAHSGRRAVADLAGDEGPSGTGAKVRLGTAARAAVPAGAYGFTAPHDIAVRTVIGPAYLGWLQLLVHTGHADRTGGYDAASGASLAAGWSRWTAPVR